MIPEIGQFALILGLLLAMVQAVPLLGHALDKPVWRAVARPAAVGQFLFLAVAFAILTWAFMVQDFSVLYVALNSNLDLPWYYRFSAVWGAHEGSLLLWALMLAAWTLAVAAFSKHLPERFAANVLAVMGLVSIGFIGFMLFTSNPFDRVLPAPIDGNDLNPLLQDFGLIVHPPMLYLGYVGFAVAFAFAIAALLEGRMEREWVRWARPWTNAAWAFLTLGIALGSWWAYYELGWGGWWFWDPVENASFMPWLVGTALIHSQAVTEKRGSFMAWTLLLSIAAFSLSLLGAFLVRSGVLTSVHAFAADPERGLYILMFLGIAIGGSLLLYAVRAPRMVMGEPFAAASRETLLLLNNMFLTVACAMVLIGTLAPLALDAVTGDKISVGPPYFGLLFVLLTIPLIVLLPFGPLTRWRAEQWWRPVRALVPAAVAALATAAVLWLWLDLPFKAVAGILGGVWVILGTLIFLWRWRRDGRRLNRETVGMVLGHIGVGVFVIGVLVTEATSIERDVALSPGESIEIAGYQFRFDGSDHRSGPNFEAEYGTVTVFRDGREVLVMHPEKREYRRGEVMTEAALDPGFTRDLYVALGEPVDEAGGWALRVYHKPFIRWIWLGALLMMAGGFWVAGERRFSAVRRPRPAAAKADKPSANGAPP
ncbi:MAG: heme lyase CcmF/NrfE family subunit [Xanthomonadales bacterium]|nr:heme lyase CcmF/NrfE family subunit [Xanthomonadales bacterium]